jgi:hypothetical protein
MKLSELFDELIELARRLGIMIRRDNGKFQSGYCIINNQKIFLLNKTTPLEIRSAMLARCLILEPIDDIFLKPAVREYLDREKDRFESGNGFKLEIKY